MLFLYRIQNDPNETSSFNALEAEGETLQDFVNEIENILQVDVRKEFSWRIRKNDSSFGYVWKDCVLDKEFNEELEGEFVMLRLLRNGTLINSGGRFPTRIVGMAQDLKSSTTASAKTVPQSNQIKKKRPQEEKLPQQQQQQQQQQASEYKVKKVPQQQQQQVQEEVFEQFDDGLTSEERARRRIEEREREEAAERDRKVQAVRDADAENLQKQDARAAIRLELRPKLEAWSGTEANRKPIRTLLCTLHTILWEGAKWTPVSVIVRPAEVRLAFRKAMLVVHPDKISAGSPPNIEVIAKYTFENLNSAYEKFEAVELK